MKEYKLNLLPYAKLIRPANSIMIGFAVLVGEAVASKTIALSSSTAFGFLTGFFVTSFSMVINDVFDAEVDRANQLDRPIATGKVKSGSAVYYSIALLFAGLLCSIATGLYTFIIAALFALLATFYNWKLKESGLPGNISVALSMTIPFLYGGLLAGRPFELLLLSMAATAFLSGVGREVIKGISDVQGDAIRNVKSIARVMGANFAAKVGAAFFLLAVLASLIPIVEGLAELPYYVIIGITDMLFIYLSIRIIGHSSSAARVKRMALMGMLLGLIGYILQGLGV
ncbi:MAG: UbiA family prenyltransferase [Nitrososphaerota archaeon]